MLCETCRDGQDYFKKTHTNPLKNAFKIVRGKVGRNRSKPPVMSD